MKTLYQIISEDYYKFDKEKLKNFITEAIWQLNQILSEEDYIEICESIFKEVMFETIGEYNEKEED
jgi:hypothetical protein